MALSLLEIVQRVRGRLGQPIPTSVAGSSDPGIIQSLGLLNEFVEDLLIRKYWQSNTREGEFYAIAAENQGALSTLFPDGFEGLLPDTFYNRTTQLQLRGGISPEEWTAGQALNSSGPIPNFRIRGNSLLLSPVPVAGERYTCEYMSSYFVYGPSDATYRTYWLRDTDTCVVGDALPMAYLKWAWKKEKGLEYAEDFRKYEALVAVKSLREKRPQVLSMNGGPETFRPGILVSPGSWPL